MHLPFRKKRIDQGSIIINAGILRQRDMACLAINLDFSHMKTHGEIIRVGLIAPMRFECATLLRNIFER